MFFIQIKFFPQFLIIWERLISFTENSWSSNGHKNNFIAPVDLKFCILGQVSMEKPNMKSIFRGIYLKFWHWQMDFENKGCFPKDLELKVMSHWTIFNDTICVENRSSVTSYCGDWFAWQNSGNIVANFWTPVKNTQRVASFQDTQKIVRSDMSHYASFCGNIVSWQMVGENRSAQH